MAGQAQDDVAPLLQQVALGDRRAFAALYQKAAPKLFAVLTRILGTGQEAEDALQEVFTRVWARADRFDPEKGQAMAWLITVARNRAIDRLRARPVEVTGAEADMADSVTSAAPGVLDQMHRGETARQIVDCLGQLEPDRSEAVKLAYLAGASYQALAERFSVPLNTMRTWLRRSLIQLRECMDR